MKQLIILFAVILLASCTKEDTPQPEEKKYYIVGNVQFRADTTVLPNYFIHVSIDNIPVGVVYNSDKLTVRTTDTLVHQYSAQAYDNNGTILFYAGQFKARDRQTIKIIIPNE
jgi:hypothetical protein